MRHYNVGTWLIALIVALLPCIADAVGLGRLNMLSNLGDPLNVEIELVSVTKEELSSLSARLSAADAYRQANLQYNAALNGARVSIERRSGGQSYLKITSNRAVNEPFIDLLVEITSSSGRLVREYTVLVDPPGVSPAPTTAAAPVARPAPAPEPPVTAPGTTAHSRCRQVCMRISRCRRSQSISATSSAPTSGGGTPGAGTWTTSSAPSPFTASMMAIVDPSASRSTPLSPG